MLFIATALADAFVIQPDRREDSRGFFARTWCQREFETHGLNPSLVQCSISYNARKGTLRGLHFQVAPHEEAKLVRCTAGAIHDVIIDLRPQSETFKRHMAVVLTAENRTMIYVPEGFAHGFQTLQDHSEVFYQMSEYYAPEATEGIRWDDPAFGIAWPDDTRIILERDLSYPDFDA